MEQSIALLVAQYGTPVLFFAQMFGIFGMPIPDELLLTVAGALVRKGTLNGSRTVAAAAAGALAGITLSYVVGRLVGVRALQHLPGRHLASVNSAQAWFERSGNWLLAVGCFIPGVRHVIPLAAGSAALDIRTFVAYAYPGAMVWSTTFVVFGYYADDSWVHSVLLRRGHLIIVSVLCCALAAAYVSLRRRERA